MSNAIRTLWLAKGDEHGVTRVYTKEPKFVGSGPPRDYELILSDRKLEEIFGVQPPSAGAVAEFSFCVVAEPGASAAARAKVTRAAYADEHYQRLRAAVAAYCVEGIFISAQLYSREDGGRAPFCIGMNFTYNGVTQFFSVYQIGTMAADVLAAEIMRGFGLAKANEPAPSDAAKAVGTSDFDPPADWVPCKAAEPPAIVIPFATLPTALYIGPDFDKQAVALGASAAPATKDPAGEICYDFPASAHYQRSASADHWSKLFYEDARQRGFKYAARVYRPGFVEMGDQPKDLCAFNDMGQVSFLPFLPGGATVRVEPNAAYGDERLLMFENRVVGYLLQLQ